jgi:PTS system mannose-specific IIA component
MIGLVLVTHGRLAAEFLAAMEHVVGPQRQISAVCIGADDDIEQRRSEIVEAIRAVDDGGGVVVLTDMFGGTPSNVSLSFLGERRVEVVTGVNLPMLIKLCTMREEKPLEELASFVKQYGQRNISVASEILPGDRK